MADGEPPSLPRRYVLSLTEPSDRCRFATAFGLAGAEVTTVAPDRATMAPNTILVTDLAVHGIVGGADGVRKMILVLDTAHPVTANAYEVDTPPAVVLASINSLG